MTKIDMTGWKMSEHGVPDSVLTVLNKQKMDNLFGIVDVNVELRKTQQAEKFAVEKSRVVVANDMNYNKKVLDAIISPEHGLAA